MKGIYFGLIIAVCLLCSVAGRAQWLPGYTARAQVDLEETNKAVGGATFYASGLCRRDGVDIRVVQGTSPVKFTVTACNPDGASHVVFATQGGQRRYTIYFGNPNEKSQPELWVPTTGLLMTTYIGGGTTNSADDCRRRINPSNAYGSYFIANVFVGAHPFGPPENFTTYIRGPINILQAGEYSFATDSHDSSFLLIDSKVIASAPGGHGPSGNIKNSGKVTLERGLHKFEYFNMLGSQPPVMVAAWQPPGAKKFEIIPANAFLSAASGKVVGYEKQGKAAVTFFRAEQGGEVLREGIQVTLVEFSFQQLYQGSPPTTFEWDFGDGIKVKGKDARVMHAYFGLDAPIITLTGYDSTGKILDVFRRQVRILPAMGEPPADEAGRIAKISEVLQSYPLSMMTGGGGTSLLKFLETTGQRAVFIKLMERELAAGAKVERFRPELGDAYFAERKFDKALEQYEKTVKETPFAANAHVQLRRIECLIRARKLDEAEKATRAFYERSAKAKPRPLERGAFLNQFIANAKVGNFEEAYRAFEDYCGRNGAVLVEAQTYLARAQALKFEKLFDAALTDLEFAEKIEPKSNFIPEIIFEQAVCLNALGRGPDAAKRMETLKKVYPNSYFASKSPTATK